MSDECLGHGFYDDAKRDCQGYLELSDRKTFFEGPGDIGNISFLKRLYNTLF